MRIKLIAGFSIVLVILITGLLLVRPTLTQHLVKKFPQNLEKELSEKILKSISTKVKVCDPIENIKDSEIIILLTPDKKVFTMPGQLIVLSKGLIQGKTKAELQTILAHQINLIKEKDALRKIIHPLPVTSKLKLYFGNYNSVFKMEGTKLLEVVSDTDKLKSEVSPINLSNREWKIIERFCAPLPKTPKKRKRIKPRRKKPALQIKKDTRSPLEKARDEGKFQYPIR